MIEILKRSVIRKIMNITSIMIIFIWDIAINIKKGKKLTRRHDKTFIWNKNKRKLDEAMIWLLYFWTFSSEKEKLIKNREYQSKIKN